MLGTRFPRLQHHLDRYGLSRRLLSHSQKCDCRNIHGTNRDIAQDKARSPSGVSVGSACDVNNPETETSLHPKDVKVAPPPCQKHHAPSRRSKVVHSRIAAGSDKLLLVFCAPPDPIMLAYTLSCNRMPGGCCSSLPVLLP